MIPYEPTTRKSASVFGLMTPLWPKTRRDLSPREREGRELSCTALLLRSCFDSRERTKFYGSIFLSRYQLVQLFRAYMKVYSKCTVLCLPFLDLVSMKWMAIVLSLPFAAFEWSRRLRKKESLNQTLALSHGGWKGRWLNLRGDIQLFWFRFGDV